MPKSLRKNPISNYSLLQIIKLNNNQLKSLDAIDKLRYLMVLEVKTNQIENLEFMAEDENELQYLQKVDLTQNKIDNLPHILCKQIYRLILDENEIATC